MAGELPKSKGPIKSSETVDNNTAKPPEKNALSGVLGVDLLDRGKYIQLLIL